MKHKINVQLIFLTSLRFDNAGASNIIRIILPDVVVLGLAVFSLVLCAKSIKVYANIRRAPQTFRNTDGGSQAASINNEISSLNVPSSVAVTPSLAMATVFTGPKLRRNQKSQFLNYNAVADSQQFRAAVMQQKILKAKQQTKKVTNWLIKISFEILFLILLAVSGGIWPSLLSVPYFILFLIIISYWSCMRQNILPSFLNKKFRATNITITVNNNNDINNQVLVTPNTTTITNHNESNTVEPNNVQPTDEEISHDDEGVFLLENATKIFLLFYLALHILLMYLYQFRFFQSSFKTDNLIVRLLGLYSAITTQCDKPAHFYFDYSLKFQQIMFPFILIFFYWILKIDFAYIKHLTTKDEQVCFCSTFNSFTVKIKFA